jgi:metal-dependent amidase/aminoacylase/carboxypeptidase family protein
MHACGHHGHTAMLLAAARHLAATRNFDGHLHLVFQLGEDGLVKDPEPIGASEDFAFFLEKVPGCYVFIGNGVGSVTELFEVNGERRARLSLQTTNQHGQVKLTGDAVVALS